MFYTLIYNPDDILLLIFQLRFYILGIWALLHIQLEVGNCIPVNNIIDWQILMATNGSSIVRCFAGEDNHFYIHWCVHDSSI
jgi:hypothetical protein